MTQGRLLSRLRAVAGDSSLLLVWPFALWMSIFVLRAHWGYIVHPSQHNVDEGYLLAVGQRMLHGRMLPYVDGVAHGGPLFLFSGALIASFNEFSYLPVRVAAALCFTLSNLLAFLCARAAGFGLAGAIASVAVPVFCVMRLGIWDGIAYNAEILVNLWLLASLLCTAHGVSAPQKKASYLLAAAGVFAAFGALSKQIGAPLAVPIALYACVAVWWRDDLDRQTRIRLLAGFAAGALTPVFAVVGYMAAGGGLRDFYYYLVTYNSDIYMYFAARKSKAEAFAWWSESRTTEVMLQMAAVTWGAAQLVAARISEGAWVRGYVKRAFVITVALLAPLSIFGARASMRDFDHYYIMAVPWFGLLVGLAVEMASPSPLTTSGKLITLYRAVLLLPLVLVLEAGWAKRRTQWAAGFPGITQRPNVCKVVDEHSKPTDTLFAWGFRGDLYVHCARRPASRYVFTTFVAGFVPWEWQASKEEENMLAVPGSRSLLLKELEQNKPPVLIDSARTLDGRSMRRYEQLVAYLDKHYKFAMNVDGEDVYFRLDPPAP